jgi:SNF2 family DNA or RNA helicase
VKAEKRRLERSRKRKHRRRVELGVARAESRTTRAIDAAADAEDLLEKGDLLPAARAAARATELDPRNAAIARFYVSVARQSGNRAELRRAITHFRSLVDPPSPVDRRSAAFERQIRKARKIQPPTAEESSRSPEPPTSRNSVAAVPPSTGPIGETLAPSPEPSLFEVPLTITTMIGGVEVLAGEPTDDGAAVRLARLAAALRDAQSYDRLFALERANGVMRFSHQEETVRKVLAVFLGRALLADEVGLGKTIEAGLLLAEYRIRGRVDSALVLAPPSLVAQWREELASKFEMESRTTEDPAFRADPERFWSGPGVVVASLATARGARHRPLVTGRPWDLIVVDEAHALKNARTESYALVASLTSRFLLLLTATPIENRVEELYNLASLLRPGHLGARRDFVRRFSGPKGKVSESARREIRALLSEIMVRNTRALSDVRLPPRFARTLLVEPHGSEAELYAHIAGALRGLGSFGRSRLLLSVLLQEAGSSPAAVCATLRKLRENPDLPREAASALAPAIDFADKAIETAKGNALLRALAAADGGAVVFTRFRATLAFLAELLGRHGIAHEVVEGDVPAPLRHRALERVRDAGGVLLSTDVGAEGLNLQFLRSIVNFDLPWNPMRIEQRIGRVHRIGQERPVEVVNLCLAGSIEERILGILDERINLFELVIGEMEMILGYLEEDREFPELVLDAFAERDAQARERSFGRIGDALAAARGRYRNVKEFDEAFFQNELGV